MRLPRLPGLPGVPWEGAIDFGSGWPPIPLFAGAAIVLGVRRVPAAARLVWIGALVLALAMAFPLPGMPFSLNVPWVPSTSHPGLQFAFHADPLSSVFWAVMTIIGLGDAINGLRVRQAWRLISARLAQLGGAAVLFSTTDLGLAASALLLLTLFSALNGSLSDDNRLEALYAPLFSGLMLMGSAAVGWESIAGFLLLLGAVALLFYQFPFTWLGNRVLGGRPGALPVNIATLGLAGAYIVIRFAAPNAQAWELQLMGVLGGLTVVMAGLNAFQAKRFGAALASIAAMEFGAALLALGIGSEAGQAAAVLLMISATPGLSALAILADRFQSMTGGDAILNIRGLMREVPRSSLLFATAAGVLAGLPVASGISIGYVVIIATALADGRFVFALLAFVGVCIGCLALARLTVPVIMPPPAPPDSPRTERTATLAAAGLLFAAMMAMGILAWTPFDPASWAAVAGFGLPRGRPIGGEILALPIPSSVLAFISLLFAVGIGTVGGMASYRQPRRSRRRRGAVIEPEAGMALVPVGDIEPDDVDRPVEFEAEPGATIRLIGQRVRQVGNALTQGVRALEGRYYMAAVLVFGLWITIILLG